MSNLDDSTLQKSGRLSFSLSIALLASVWMVVLPWLSVRPRMAAHLEWLDARGINAGAMYYTELEAMEPILHRLERPSVIRAFGDQP